MPSAMLFCDLLQFKSTSSKDAVAREKSDHLNVCPQRNHYFNGDTWYSNSEEEERFAGRVTHHESRTKYGTMAGSAQQPSKDDF